MGRRRRDRGSAVIALQTAAGSNQDPNRSDSLWQVALLVRGLRLAAAGWLGLHTSPHSFLRLT